MVIAGFEIVKDMFDFAISVNQEADAMNAIVGFAHEGLFTPDAELFAHLVVLIRQAWSNDSGTDEWHSWAQHYAVNLPTSSGIGFDRSDLAVIAAMNHIGVAMGRKRLVQKRLASGELVAPFGDMTVKCHQHYYITTLPGRQWPKIEAFITWLREQVKTTS